MNHKVIEYDSAFEALLEAMEETNSVDVAIGKCEKQLHDLKNNRDTRVRNEYIRAANYFTKEKICELHRRTVDLLKCDDFNEDEYIQIFSDSSKIKREHIAFLVHRQQEIKEFEHQLDSDNKTEHIQKPNGFWDVLADIFNGGNANDD